MDYTQYLHLSKPDIAVDHANINDLNGNMDTIDEAIHDIETSGSGDTVLQQNLGMSSSISHATGYHLHHPILLSHTDAPNWQDHSELQDSSIVTAGLLGGDTDGTLYATNVEHAQDNGYFGQTHYRSLADIAEAISDMTAYSDILERFSIDPVDGLLTISEGFKSTGYTTLGSRAIVIGTTDIHMYGSVDFYSDIDLNAPTGQSSTSIHGPITFGDDVSFNNDVTFGDAVSFSDDVTFDRSPSFNDGLTVSGDISAGDVSATNIEASNEVRAETGYFNSDVYIEGNLTLVGDVAFNNITAADADFSGYLTVSGGINADMNFNSGYYPYVDNMPVVGVEANPSSTATDTLTSVNIGGIVYDIDGGNTNYQELTQAEYDALTEAEKTNGTLYFITDGEGGGGSAELDILGEASGAVASFADGASAGLAKCIADIVPKQAGTGTPSPDNVRAISGYTAVKVDVAGKNHVRTQDVATSNISVTKNINGSVTATGYSNGTTRLPKFGFASLKAGTYILSGISGGSNNTYGLRITDTNNQYILDLYDGEQEFTLLEDTSIYLLGRFSANQTAAFNVTFYPMIRLATESDTFEPYKGNTTTTPLGQTVYGGQLNVLTGELTIEHVQYVFDGSEQIVAQNTGWGTNVLDNIIKPNINNNTMSDILCDIFSPETPSHVWNHTSDNIIGIAVESDNYKIRFYSSAFVGKTSSEVATEMTGHMLVYPLATPQTVQLTPQEVNSLLGQNNISADTGDIDIVYVKASAPIQPNPTGTPTATLKKLGIEGTVFEVPSGGGGSSGGINYSTTEQVIGTWIDGKPLYQKVMYSVTQVQLIDTVWTNIPWAEEPTNIDLLIDAKLTNNVPNNSNNIRFSVVNGRICGASTKTGNFPPTSDPVYVVFEYTKITD